MLYNRAMKEVDTPEETSLATFYNRMIYQICREEGIEMKLLCHNFVKRLEKGGEVRFVMGYKFDLNPHGEGCVLDDKYATYSALECERIPAVEHLIIYPATNCHNYALGRNSVEYVMDYFRRHNGRIVLKPNCGTVGRQVSRVTEEEQIAPTLMNIFCNNETACMSPFYVIKHEYRVILLDGEVELAYMKTLANPEDWKFNLQQGAKSEGIPNEKYGKVVKLAKRAAKSIGLRFGSVDIVEAEGDLRVLEINSGVMIRKFAAQHPEQVEKVTEIYRKAIRRMFE